MRQTPGSWLTRCTSSITTHFGTFEGWYRMCDIAANSFEQQSSFSRDQQQDSLSQLCVPELVSAQAAATPSATALTHGRRSLSYQELDRRADRVAHVLRSLGV